MMAHIKMGITSVFELVLYCSSDFQILEIYEQLNILTEVCN